MRLIGVVATLPDDVVRFYMPTSSPQAIKDVKGIVDYVFSKSILSGFPLFCA